MTVGISLPPGSLAEPANIYLADDGAVKLLDFGAARYSTGHATKMLSQIFTPGFAPIEQYQERSRQGPWTDLYAVGASLYYLLTGKLPPEAHARAHGAPHVPAHQVPGCDANEALAAALERALQLSSSARWATAREMQEALRAASQPALRRTIPAAPLVRVASALQPSPAPTSKSLRLGLIIAGGALVSLWLISSFVSGWREATACPKGMLKEQGRCVNAADEEEAEDVLHCPPGTQASGKRCVPSPKTSSRPPRLEPDVPVVPEVLGSCPSTMIRIPGGRFVTGEKKEEATIRPFCLDRTEVTVADFQRCAYSKVACGFTDN